MLIISFPQTLQYINISALQIQICREGRLLVKRIGLHFFAYIPSTC